MKLTIGLPRQLRNHEYPGLWEDFFRRLDMDTVFSLPTNKAVFDMGVKMCTGDFCLPMKLIHGHTLSLRDRADAVFIPRFIYPSPKEAACPKFCALPDILRHNLHDVPIWEMSIDMKKGLDYTLSTLDELARLLSRRADEVRGAFLKALTRPGFPKIVTIKHPSKRQSKQHSKQQGKHPSEQSYEQLNLKLPAGISSQTRPTIGLIGHTYLVQDEFATMNLHKKIVSRGYSIVTSEDISYELQRKVCCSFQESTRFWGVGADILGTALSLLKDESIKGLIYVTSFSCGIDSVVLELLERYAQKIQTLPRMRLCLDEHTGESGLDTRLEAFFDLLERRNASTEHATIVGS